MEQAKVESTAPGERYVIERPRLTRMLDESNARIILLVAPAGYGKTTLARQWFARGDKRVAWYRAQPASADVAALADGIARTASVLIPGARSLMLRHLQSSGDHGPETLADALAAHLQSWPEGAWLAVDDYEYILNSDASELFFEHLVDATPLHLLVASRRRPPWATGRRILYGELYEIGRSALTLAQEEARHVLAGVPAEDAEELIAHS